MSEQLNNQTTEQPGRLVSQAEAERMANIPHSRFAKLMASGAIQPDNRTSRGVKLFTLASVDKIRQLHSHS